MTRRVLSLWQPWAMFTVAQSLSSCGLRWKRFETRHFRPEKVVRGIQLPIPVAIHATKKWTPELREFTEQSAVLELLRDIGYRDPRLSCVEEHGTPLPLGAIIGVATIVKVTPTADLVRDWRCVGSVGMRACDGEECGACGGTGWAFYTPEEMLLGNYEPGRFGWELADPIELDEPIQFSGRQDVLYEVPADVEARIDAQLAAVSS